MSPDAERTAPQGIVGRLQAVLKHLTANPYPKVPNPPNCRKRASVALIIRVQPCPAHWPPQSPGVPPDTQKGPIDSAADCLDKFFSLLWVQHGEPEVLFIKRAARARDRWGSHIALPGGKRDPGDKSDQATAVRETWEEVGLDLSSRGCVFVGNLPERVVTTSWGKVPLMVLCPFVYVFTEHNMPSLKLQPSEVGSTHWVPFRALLLPSLQTYEHCDISDRLANRGGAFIRVFLRAMLGQMVYAAVRLVPSESLYSDISMWLDLEDSAAASNPLTSLLQRFCDNCHAGSASRDRPLLLWGLTLGILTDFLHLLSPHSVLGSWSYPTFTSMDVRLIIWAMTYRFRRKKQSELRRLQAVPTNSKLANPLLADGSGSGVGVTRGLPQSLSPSITGRLLDGYYDLVRKAIAIAIITRIGIGAGFTTALWTWYRHRRGP